MKKKTSLWISGITTVAMLAVAVGSFAAWNSLSATSDVFSATTDTRAEITITKDDAYSPESTTKHLLPKNVNGKVDGSGDDLLYVADSTSDEVTVGAFTLATKDDGNKIDVQYAASIKDKDSTLSDVDTYFETVLYKYEESVDANKGTKVTAEELKNLPNGKYVVALKFKDNSTDSVDSATLDTLVNKTMNVTAKCTAVKTTP